MNKKLINKGRKLGKAVCPIIEVVSIDDSLMPVKAVRESQPCTHAVQKAVGNGCLSTHHS